MFQIEIACSNPNNVFASVAWAREFIFNIQVRKPIPQAIFPALPPPRGQWHLLLFMVLQTCPTVQCTSTTSGTLVAWDIDISTGVHLDCCHTRYRDFTRYRVLYLVMCPYIRSQENPDIGTCWMCPDIGSHLTLYWSRYRMCLERDIWTSSCHRYPSGSSPQEDILTYPDVSYFIPNCGDVSGIWKDTILG